ncbi:MAG: lysylphosphatidylglycerol synthase transmembrane domain-containing protein [Bacteroidales bacterium]|nr:lysylphosphatidylglycerol synthase transmembrane domain-containing protein [Bacteroidales bacterium]
MKKIKKVLQIVLPLALAVLLFWWVYRDMNFSKLMNVFHGGIHYEWFLLSFFLSVLSNLIRGIRWHQLIEPVCPGGRLKVTILSIFVAYAANLLFPRAGEVARCGILKKSDGLSFTKTLGTVITERAVDVIFLLVIALATILFQMGFFRNFFMENPSSLDKLIGMVTSPIIWGGLLTVVILSVVFRKRIRHFRFYEKISGFMQKIWEGMKSIMMLKRPFLFICWSLLIWLIYFLMFYIGKYFFSFEVPLGVLAMLSGFVMGSFGVIAPVQGGIGAYHFMVIYTLVFYGISEPDACVFAFVIHGLQIVVTLLTGLIAYIWISVLNKKNNVASVLN